MATLWRARPVEEIRTINSGPSQCLVFHRNSSVYPDNLHGFHARQIGVKAHNVYSFGSLKFDKQRSIARKINWVTCRNDGVHLGGMKTRDHHHSLLLISQKERSDAARQLDIFHVKNRAFVRYYGANATSFAPPLTPHQPIR